MEDFHLPNILRAFFKNWGCPRAPDKRNSEKGVICAQLILIDGAQNFSHMSMCTEFCSSGPKTKMCMHLFVLVWYLLN